MFTGIIRQTGKIQKIETRNGLKILTVKIYPNKKESQKRSLKIGDSIAIDGCCLTITSCTKNLFIVDAMPETLNKTIIPQYKKGTVVNLENPLKIGDSLDGHFVQGHIDFTGTVMKVEKEGDSKKITISIPKPMRKYFALKGSVTVNGVSLTISKVTADSFQVALIPQTLKTTNLNSLKKTDKANIEIDVLARYVLAQK
jgi:riboflavin synthase